MSRRASLFLFVSRMHCPAVRTGLFCCLICSRSLGISKTPQIENVWEILGKGAEAEGTATTPSVLRAVKSSTRFDDDDMINNQVFWQVLKVPCSDSCIFFAIHESLQRCETTPFSEAAVARCHSFLIERSHDILYSKIWSQTPQLQAPVPLLGRTPVRYEEEECRLS